MAGNKSRNGDKGKEESPIDQARANLYAVEMELEEKADDEHVKKAKREVEDALEELNKADKTKHR